MVGGCRLSVTGQRGTEVTLRHAETLKPDGTLYTDNLRGALATDLYVLRGGGPEVYEPRFTYHGFRYVELRGFPGKPTLETLQGRVVHDDLPSVGRFNCSNALLNQIYRNVVWGVRGNYRSIPTDCPQRDERQGWLGDRSAESRGEGYLFDHAALYCKWMDDMSDSQKENGSIPDVSPAYWPIYSDNVTWPSSYIIIPGTLYEMYGDRRLVEEHYPYMKRWIEFMAAFLKEGVLPPERDRYGDWCVPPESPELIHSKDPARQTPKDLLATAYFYHDVALMARAAMLLGKAEDARRLGELAEAIRVGFQKKFFVPQANSYGNGSQTSQVLPLAFRMVPTTLRPKVLEGLVQNIQTKTQGHVGTGLVGGQWLMGVLSEGGRPDVAYTIATQTTYPSWGYMVSRGATTVWELWNGDTADPAMNSGNHVMLVGDLITWLYEHLAGIRPDPKTPGFQHVLMRPTPVGDLKFVEASYRSIHGTITSSWKIEGGKFLWTITLPPNTTATAFVPTKDYAAVTEGGRPAKQAKGTELVRPEAGRAIIELQSGTYHFAAPW